MLSNEITTGFGRLGTWFGFQQYDIKPDIVAMGKCPGNGYPVSAVAVTKTVAERLESGGFHHVQSHQNDPLGCTVAEEVIKTLKVERWIECGNATGQYFMRELLGLKNRHESIKEIRGKGMLFAIELVPDEQLTAKRLYKDLLRNEIIVLFNNVRNLIRLDPPLTIDKSDVDHFISTMDRILSKAE